MKYFVGRRACSQWPMTDVTHGYLVYKASHKRALWAPRGAAGKETADMPAAGHIKKIFTLEVLFSKPRPPRPVFFFSKYKETTRSLAHHTYVRARFFFIFSTLNFFSSSPEEQSAYEVFFVAPSFLIVIYA